MSTSAANETTAESPKEKPTLNHNAHNEEEMFSPTSAAALALSTLHHFGDQQRPSTASLKATRLFNNSESQEIPEKSPQYYSSPGPYPPLHPSYYGHFGMWSRGDAPSNKPPPMASHWSYPYPSATSYPVEGHVVNRGSTPSLVGPSPPPSRSNSACAPESVYYHHPHPPRTSPVAFVGPSPPLSRSNSFVPHASENPTSSEKPYARAQSATTLVTPTPKKAKPDPPAPAPKTEPGYSRKKKSLGVLAENFLKTYQNLPRGSIVIVDEAAIKLGVERRRIYDVVNILESISLVCKKHKNTYTWMGMDHLDAVFGRMQAEALEEHPEDAKQFLGVTGLSHREPSPPPPKGREFKSLARLSQDFLQVFLVGHKVLSLPDASDKIQGTTSMEELVAMGQKNKKALDEKELKAAAARGLKTKIRRLYDIANVFLSVGLLEKVDSSDSTRRPNFAWAYRLSAKDLYELHRPSKKNQGESNPENDGHISENIPASTTPCRSTSASPITSNEIKAQEGDKENEWTVNEIPSAAASCEKNIKKEPMIHDAMSQPVAAIPPCSSTNSSSTFSDNHVAV